MKKSLIALAVMAASGAAFAATSNVDVYGQARISVSNTDNGAGAFVNDEGSRLGIKGSEDLGGGLSAIWQWETGLVLDGGTATANVNGTTDTVMGGIGTQRNTFVGLKGAFGTVLAGTHDTPYKLAGSADVFGDTRADAQKSTTGIIGRNTLDNRAHNAVAYITPDFNGFHAAVATVASESSSASANAATSFALVYVNGPLKATYGHEKFAKSASAGGTDGQVGDKLNVSYKLGDTTLGATYETSRPAGTVAGTAALKDTAYLVSVAHAMGPITLAAQYGSFNDKDATATDVKRSTIGAIYSLSKRTNAMIAYSSDNLGVGGVDSKTSLIQLNHSF